MKSPLSIFGGIGSVHGTLLGVAAIAVLTNGLSRIPGMTSNAREVAGIMTAALLVAALAASAMPKMLASLRQRRQSSSQQSASTV